MVDSADRAAAKLFNNPALSDVTIKQIYVDQVREYHAHKAVLCMESEYFLNMFTGKFKEASDKVVELHEDDPEHFEFVLKFIYTNKYDKAAIVTSAGSDKVKRVLLSIGLYQVADKYAIPNIYEAAAEDVQDVLTSTDDVNFEMLRAAIHGHYGSGANVDSAMGKLITSVVLENRVGIIRTVDFERMLQAYPMFGADVALALHRKDKIDLSKISMYKCIVCSRKFPLDVAELRSEGGSYFYCCFCGEEEEMRSL